MDTSRRPLDPGLSRRLGHLNTLYSGQYAGQPGGRPQAGTWGAVTHYLKAAQAAGTTAAGPVMEQMRAIPINDFMIHDGKLRIDGIVVRETFLLRAKRPAQSHSEWDLLEVAQTITGDEAFRPLQDGGSTIYSCMAV